MTLSKGDLGGRVALSYKQLGDAFRHSFKLIEGEDDEVLIHGVPGIKVGPTAEGICFHSIFWFVS